VPPIIEERPCIYRLLPPSFPTDILVCPPNIFDKSTPVVKKASETKAIHTHRGLLMQRKHFDVAVLCRKRLVRSTDIIITFAYYIEYSYRPLPSFGRKMSVGD